ncbi:MAG: NADH-quinone oxidoreductase subunit D [Chloroflexi bacterium HGW-Chloroflexi-2]|jgi:NADH-quinone oxidoreductase subunit D|nr:MAG: NADH-quinone oxidoreductase subunit D [Chloroflexi bacterium HGW-Chloroflexi-2]
MTDIREVSVDELRHLVSDRAMTGETMLLNMGPQHPSTHGVLRLLLELDGEVVVNVIPDIGFLHTGVEKNAESKNYQQSEVMTDRLDYLNPMGNNLTYCLAVEKLTELDVPPRAQAIRVILAELQRISSHLLWLGTSALDLGAMSVFLYCMRERELVLNIFELVSGQRMMTTFIRPGGLWRDVPVEFEATVRDFLKAMPRRIKEYDDLLEKNEIFLDRTKGIGILTKEDCFQYGLSGPVIRGSGVAHDLRKKQPYSGYDLYDFDIPTHPEGDVYARYRVRVEEMTQSLRIIEQALNKMPYGPVRSNNRKYVPPPRSEIGVSMEALIHHFKLWTEGFTPPAGHVYAATESPRGELGVYMESDGTAKPYRVHLVTPTFVNLQAIPVMSRKHYIADLIGIIGSIDVVLGDSDR